MLNTGGDIFVGGGPDPSLLTGGRWSEGFKGCVHTLTFGEKDVNFNLDSIKTSNVLPCTE